MGETGTVARELGLAVVWTPDEAARRRVVDRARTLSDVRRVHAVRWTPELVAANCSRFDRPAVRPPDGGDDPGPLLVFVLERGNVAADQHRAHSTTAAALFGSAPAPVKPVRIRLDRGSSQLNIRIRGAD